MSERSNADAGGPLSRGAAGDTARPGLLRRGLGATLGALFDPTIALAFARPGYLARALAFDPRDLAVSLERRTALVTGANQGIGFETAKALARLGARVVLACRDEGRGREAAERITREADADAARLAVERVDMGSLASVRALGERLAGREIDILVHNAGMMVHERRETAEGLELTFATHVVGPYLLTALLAPGLRAAARARGPSRVVWVSSGGMYGARLDLELPARRDGTFDGIHAYAHAKRCQVILAARLDARLAGAGVVSAAMHPGWVETTAVRESLPRFHAITRPILRSPREGADTVVWLAAGAAEDARSPRGRFFLDRLPRRVHLRAATRETAAEADRLEALVAEAAGLDGPISLAPASPPAERAAPPLAREASPLTEPPRPATTVPASCPQAPTGAR